MGKKRNLFGEMMADIRILDEGNRRVADITTPIRKASNELDKLLKEKFNITRNGRRNK